MGVLDLFRQAEKKQRDTEQVERSRQQEAQRATLEAQERAATAERARQSQQTLERASLPALRAKEPGPAERLVSDDAKQRVRDAGRPKTPKPEPQPEKAPERPVVAAEKEHKFQPAHPQPSVGPGNFTSRTVQRESLAASLQRQSRAADDAMTPAQRADRDRQRSEQKERLDQSRARALFDPKGRSRSGG